MPRKSPAYYLNQLQGIARDRGGELLSDRYLGDTTKLRFRCAQGHVWAAAPTHIKQAKWCPRCGWARAGALRKAPAIAKLRRLVARCGGAILSPRYVNSQTKLRFRCRERHEWDAVPNSILQGTWCPVCGRARQMKHHARRKERVFRRLRRIVARLGGVILPPGFVGYHARLRLRCARGHTWQAGPESIESGVWCPRCKQEALLARLRARARAQGGACLSRSCRRKGEPLSWRCAVGHRWKAPARRILGGVWCPRCRRPGRDNLERMRRMARERGGACLSKVYVDSGSKLLWRCREGHEWLAEPQRIVQGVWCRSCRRGWGRSRRRLTIQMMREMARERGGACLSDAYRGIYDRLRWRCAEGHEWVTAANNVRRGGWCPICAHTVRGTLDGMRALAIERGGRCLTRTWDDHRQPLHFECARGHRFHLHANVAKSGVWCRECPR